MDIFATSIMSYLCNSNYVNYISLLHLCNSNATISCTYPTTKRLINFFQY